MMKKRQIYVGNIYKVVNIKISKQEMQCIEDIFPLTSTTIIPTSIENIKPILELYKANAILIKKNEHCLSNYIDLDTGIKLSVFPYRISSLIVIPEELKSYYDLREANEKISKRQLVKKHNYLDDRKRVNFNN